MSGAPRLSPGTRFTFDKVRDRWCLLAPERLFEIDEQVADVLKHVDGTRSLEEIVAALAQEYDAPPRPSART